MASDQLNDLKGLSLESFAKDFDYFWETSGNFTQQQWEKILASAAGDEFRLTTIYSGIVSFGVYWIVGSFYTFLDLTAIAKRYKIQPEKNSPVSPLRVFQVLLHVLFNQSIVALPVTVLFFKLMNLRCDYYSLQLPSFNEFLLHIVACTVIEEFAFYYSHRFLHLPVLYRHIHKKHHEWTAPIAITAEYCHPLEQILSNLVPVFLGPLIMGSHLVVCWIWISLAILSTLLAHSGYRLPMLPSPDLHDAHHQKFNYNFGVFGVLDYLHGTYLKIKPEDISSTKKHKVKKLK